MGSATRDENSGGAICAQGLTHHPPSALLISAMGQNFLSYPWDSVSDSVIATLVLTRRLVLF